MKAINVSKLRMPQIDGYIKRNQEMKAFKHMLYDPGLKTNRCDWATWLRKVNSSAQHCLAGKAGAVRVFLNPQSSFSEEKFAEKVMKTIGLPCTPGELRSLLILMMQMRS